VKSEFQWLNQINQTLLWLDGLLGSAAYFPFLLLGVGLFFTFYLRLPQFRFFGEAWRVLCRTKGSENSEQGDISPFQALTTALSGTVGTGNIGGVAFAIYLGGPASLFWMWVTAILGMTTKMVEVSLSCKYREILPDKSIAGGPMYFMDKRLNQRWLAVIFSIATVICSFGVGNMPQSNNIAVSMEEAFAIEPLYTGISLAILLGLVIIGGIKRIAKFASMFVPVMSLIYILGALSVILMHLDQLLPSLQSIFVDAFTGSAATGGFLGASFAFAFNRGVNRGLFSNEAGMGSAPIAHASAKTNVPLEEGLVSLLEPFLDTLVICTLTGLVILTSGAWSTKHMNHFQTNDMVFIQGVYEQENPKDQKKLLAYLSEKPESGIQSFSGALAVEQGQIAEQDFTLLASRSIAEDVQVLTVEGTPFTGSLVIHQGNLQTQVSIKGKSLLHSSRLTIEAFMQGYLGSYGQYIVAVGLLLFAFSTSISWSYYGDRAIVYLMGEKGVVPFRMLYIAGFWFASVQDTVLIWNLAAVSVVLMTLPNLLSLVLLHREVKQMTLTHAAHQK
jgi:AGCS family alanine or glycine:cation symporter